MRFRDTSQAGSKDVALGQEQWPLPTIGKNWNVEIVRSEGSCLNSVRRPSFDFTECYAQDERGKPMRTSVLHEPE